MQEEAGRQGEERDPGVGGAQEPNVSAPDQEGAGGTAYGFEEFVQDLPGEGPTAAAAGDDAVGGAAVGAAGDGFGIGETIEDASGPVLDPPGAAGDVPFGGAFDPVGEAVKDVGGSPGVGDALGGIAPDVVWSDVGDVGEQAGGEAVDAALYGPGMGNPAPSAPTQAAPETAAPAEATANAEATTADETTDTYTDSDGKMWVDGDDWNRLATDYSELLEHTESQQQVDALADAAEDVGEAVADSVETLPFVGDALGDALGDAHDVVEDVIDHMDEPVVDDIDPWG